MGNNAKKSLYDHVDHLRSRLGLSLYDHPVNTLDLCLHTIAGIEVIHHSFDSAGFCGAAFAGDEINTIVLNSARSEIEQNFDCGHEIIHLSKHREENGGIFRCFEEAQNSFLEWEANEGSAQLIVPYQDFIPRFVHAVFVSPTCDTFMVPELLATYYHVSPRVVEIRMDSLSYEIDQYRCGVPVEKLELLSRRQQQKRGIRASCYSAKCAFSLDWDSAIG